MYAAINKRPRPKFQSAREQVYVPLQGAVDIVTQDLKRSPGSASLAINFEPDLEDSFRRIDGYERYDGQTAPTLGVWHTVELTDASDREVGETLTGAGGGSGVILLIDGNTVAITAFNGTDFVADETTNGAGDVVDVQLLFGPMDGYRDIEIELETQNYYRDLIDAMPGEGRVLGIWRHLNKVYAVRNNVGSSQAILYKGTAAGWEAVDLHHMLRFDAGTGAFVYGEAITSAGTGVGVVRRVILLDGDWGDSDAAGYLMVEVTSGAFLDNETLTGGASGSATANGNASATTLLPNGRYEFISHNFYAQANTYHVYGCDGVNYAFEIDANDVYTPLITASVPDTPKYIAAHKFYLWLAIGASVISSEPGVPYGFNGQFGAGEYAVGATITGLKVQPGEVMSVATLRNIWGMYGDGTTENPFRPELISIDAGAVDYSFVTLGFPFGLNDQGIVAQQRVNAYGNFEAATISRAIQPLIDQKKLLLTATSVLRKRNQLRFYFSDKTVIVIAFSLSAEGMMARATTLNLDHVVRCICNAADENGAERILFGSDNGMVYEMERGFTFDGEPIDWYLKLNPWNPTGNVRRKFHLYGAIPQIKTGSDFQLAVTHEASYGSEDNAPSHYREKTIFGGGGYFDDENWDELRYDSAEVSQVGFPLSGDMTAVSLSLYGDDVYTKSFKVEGITFDISPRGTMRAY